MTNKKIRTLPKEPEINGESSLGPYDIICGRNNVAFHNVGNRRFRVTISLNLKRYMEAQTRAERTKVIQSVVDVVKDCGARLIKKGKKEEFEEVDDKCLRQKVQHALRDLAASLQTPSPSPCTSKKTKKAFDHTPESPSKKAKLKLGKKLKNEKKAQPRAPADDLSSFLECFCLDEECMLVTLSEKAEPGDVDIVSESNQCSMNSALRRS